MGLIYHMIPAQTWASVQKETAYRTDSLAEEGFIHCTGELTLVHEVANRFYRVVPDNLIVLAIDEQAVVAPVKWEPADGHLFPHIYGPLNLDAVTKVIPFEPDNDGIFSLPDELK